MSAEEWEQIKRLFAAALVMPESERAGYLATACGHRTDLLRMVEELLASHWDVATVSRAVTESWAPMLAPGEFVAQRYRIVRFIARGGMGEVYEVYDERLRFRLALKTLRFELSTDRAALARFERELLITRDVAHDSLCRLYDFVEHGTPAGTVPCLTMELLQGESLSDLLLRQRPLEFETALPWIEQIAAAMTTLHERGIIHRDLKPSNIMLATRHQRPRQAVVTDFGLAKMKNSGSDLFESQVNLQAGAPYFMAPELLRQEDPSIASDIYSFGLLIDEMVTSRRAFSAESLQALYFAKLWEQPIPPCQRAENLPEHWNDVILRCLEQDPNRRFSTIAEVVETLRAPRPRWRRKLIGRRTVLTAGAGAVLVIAGTAAGLTRMLPAKATVGVFDIENRTGTQFDYLCRGTVAELMRRLGNLEGVDVQRLYATRQAAAGPKRGYSLDGALDEPAGKLRLTMQLLDNPTGKVVWSEDFGRRIVQPVAAGMVSNLLDLQTEIATQTVSALEGALGFAFRVNSALRRWHHGAAFAAGSPTVSNVAFDQFLRGQTLLNEGTPTTVPAAVETFNRAIAEDPHFALAYAALAQAYLNWMNFDQQRTDEFAQKARASAEKALQEDPQLAEAHAAMGAVRQEEWDWTGSQQSYDESLRLKPRFPRALRWRAGLFLQFGRFDEAVRGMEQARELDPFDRTAAAGHGLTLLFAGRLPEAIALLEDAVAGRDMIVARFNLGQAYARYAYLLANSQSPAYYVKAFQEAETVGRSEAGGPRLANQMAALFHSMKGDNTAAAPYLREMEREMESGGSPVRVAWIYAIQHDLERALSLLERALLARDSSLSLIKVNPYLENLRGLPRFEAIVRAMRLA